VLGIHSWHEALAMKRATLRDLYVQEERQRIVRAMMKILATGEWHAIRHLEDGQFISVYAVLQVVADTFDA
jgi:hypothetical protein